MILNSILSFESFLNSFQIQKSKYQRLYNWFYDDTLGTLDFARYEVMTIKNHKKFHFHSFDNILIDGIILFHEENNFEKNQPFIIYCCPNAGYYETLAFES